MVIKVIDVSAVQYLEATFKDHMNRAGIVYGFHHLLLAFEMYELSKLSESKNTLTVQLDVLKGLCGTDNMYSLKDWKHAFVPVVLLWANWEKYKDTVKEPFLRSFIVKLQELTTDLNDSEFGSSVVPFWSSESEASKRDFANAGIFLVLLQRFQHSLVLRLEEEMMRIAASARGFEITHIQLAYGLPHTSEVTVALDPKGVDYQELKTLVASVWKEFLHTTLMSLM